MYKYKAKTVQVAGLAYLRLITIGYHRLLRPFSRLSRKLFESKRIKRAYGVAMVSVVLSSVILPGQFWQWKLMRISQAQAQSTTIASLMTERSLRLPLETYTVTQKYGLFHPGIDLAAQAGHSIFPVMDGVILSVVRDRFGYGNHVIIDHGNGIQSLYAHMSKILVKEHDTVTKDTVIGTVGSTGHSTGPHLHLQIWQDGGWVNPERFLEDYLETQIEKPNQVVVPKLARK
jgi:murein DD-endopeptidase MepM/ murein hydrolase activator NlpD